MIGIKITTAAGRILELLGQGTPLERAVSRGLDKAAEIAVDAATDANRPAGDDLIILRPSSDERVVTYASDKWYLNFLESGRKGFNVGGGHRKRAGRVGRSAIGPKRGKEGVKALRFVVNGETIFRKSVGPIEPKPFMAPASAAAEGQVAGILTEEVNKALGQS